MTHTGNRNCNDHKRIITLNGVVDGDGGGRAVQSTVSSSHPHSRRRHSHQQDHRRHFISCFIEDSALLCVAFSQLLAHGRSFGVVICCRAFSPSVFFLLITLLSRYVIFFCSCLQSLLPRRSAITFHPSTRRPPDRYDYPIALSSPSTLATSEPQVGLVDCTSIQRKYVWTFK